jgi:hypothetical protein
VDTPGVGSVYSHNNATAEAFLSHLDVAIFVLGVDPVLTQTEMEWLLKVKDQGERFFFVLNKIDQLSDSEVHQVIHFTQERLKELWGSPGRVYALSARNALADPDKAVFLCFRNDLQEFLDQKGQETLFSASRKKVERTIRNILAILALERKAVDRPVEELRALLKTLNDLEEKLTLECDRAYWVMDQAQTRVLVKSEKIFDVLWEAVKDQARDEVEHAWSASSTIGRARMKMAEALEKRLEVVFSDLREKGEAISRRQFESTSAYLQKEYQDLMSLLTTEVFSQLDLKPFPMEVEMPGGRPSRFYVSIPPELLWTAGGSLINILPRAWGNRWVKKAFIRRLDDFYGMQKARLLTEIVDRFQEQSTAVVMGLIETSQKILAGVKQAVERGVSLQERSEQERTVTIQELTNRESALQILLSEAQLHE